MAARRAVTCNSARAHKIMKTRYNGDKIFMQFFFFFLREMCAAELMYAVRSKCHGNNSESNDRRDFKRSADLCFIS